MSPPASPAPQLAPPLRSKMVKILIKMQKNRTPLVPWPGSSAPTSSLSLDAPPPPTSCFLFSPRLEGLPPSGLALHLLQALLLPRELSPSRSSGTRGTAHSPCGPPTQPHAHQSDHWLSTPGQPLQVFTRKMMLISPQTGRCR